ncbi:dihydrofolate reductase family protein [Agrococcus sp. SGAir0287]|uniref:dihydrofolate reductase family protein n=1 Tax=Agrococcus sp. SGAir0287 TaxID=2070347 RepID=UPI0010CD68E6|nr:dihydrofolate reductase family protein [Agrococcus sp. SGAir0287]QCR18796.1 riboflavin biosynthesis protein RibD [Agrococcus sp. SGAir0287]
MRELTYLVATSLDGCIASPDGAFDAFPVSGDHMAAVVDDYADTLPIHAQRALGVRPERSRFDTVVMGWRTLEPALAIGVASPYPHLRQVVATRRERDVDAAIETTDDPIATVRALKRESGTGIWLAGGGELAGALLPEIDRLVLKVNPIAFGSGIRLLGDAPYDPTAFERVAVRAFDSGVTILELVRAR